MFIWFRHHWKLYRLNLQQRKLDNEAERLFRESQEKNDSSIIDNWHDNNYRAITYLEYARAEMVSDSLLKQADALYLPRPSYNDPTKWQKWTPDEEDGSMSRQLLSAEGMTEVRQAIRKERRERREAVEYWLKVAGGFIGILTGLVGALIGLVSIWKHR
jgi:hypothetical protein